MSKLKLQTSPTKFNTISWFKLDLLKCMQIPPQVIRTRTTNELSQIGFYITQTSPDSILIFHILTFISDLKINNF